MRKQKEEKNKKLAPKEGVFDFDLSQSKEYFFENLALMLAARVDIIVALDGLAKEIKSKKIQKLIVNIKDDIQSGFPLWKTLQNNRVLPEHLLALVKVGEESGNLVENLQIAISQQQKDRDFRAKIQSASLYPMIIFGVMIFVGTGIALFVLPNLANVYSSFNTDLPFITRLLIDIGVFFKQYGFIAAPAFLIITFLIFFFVFLYSKTKFIGQAIILSIPPLRKIITEVELNRLGYLFGILIKNGFPIVPAIRLLEGSTTYRIYQKFYKYMGDEIENGRTFQQILNSYPKINRILPTYPKEIVITSEKTGTLADSLLKIGEIYEKKSDLTIKNLSVMFEPALLILVWLGVAVVALAVILPIYSLIGDFSSISDANPPAKTEVEETPLPTILLTPAPTEEPLETTMTPEMTSAVSPSVEILDTETNYLNVRETIGGKSFARVYPGETYPYTEERNGWYKITLTDGQTGWVSGTYVKEI